MNLRHCEDQSFATAWPVTADDMRRIQHQPRRGEDPMLDEVRDALDRLYQRGFEAGAADARRRIMDTAAAERVR